MGYNAKDGKKWQMLDTIASVERRPTVVWGWYQTVTEYESEGEIICGSPNIISEWVVKTKGL